LKVENKNKNQLKNILSQSRLTCQTRNPDHETKKTQFPINLMLKEVIEIKNQLKKFLSFFYFFYFFCQSK